VLCTGTGNDLIYTGTHLKLDRSLDDAGMYVEHTGTSVKTLLVTNYAELEEVIGQASISDTSLPELLRRPRYSSLFTVSPLLLKNSTPVGCYKSYRM
jgi:hypothetical protein